jgi:hypothetical protein
MIPLSLIVIQFPNVSAEYIPFAESPVKIGDCLVYQVQYDFNGSQWEGYYRFNITRIQLSYSSKMIKASWQSSVDLINWNLVEQDVAIGDISLNDINFDEMTLIQHKYFDYSWKPSEWAPVASAALEGFIANKYHLNNLYVWYTGSSAEIVSISNSTHQNVGYSDEWSFKLGVLERKCIYVVDNEYSDIFYFEWNLLVEVSRISGFDLNYWGTPAIDDTGFGVGDYFVYNMTQSNGINTDLIKARLMVSAMIVDPYYKSIQFIAQMWNETTSKWENPSEAYQIVDYSLSGEIYGMGQLSYMYPFIPSGVNFQDQKYQGYKNADYYWNTIIHTNNVIQYDYDALGPKSFNMTWLIWSEGNVVENHIFNNFSSQGYLTRMCGGTNTSIYLSMELLLSESSITPCAPVLNSIDSPTTESTMNISWGSVYEAQSYNVYVNDILVGSTANTQYELNLDGYGSYIIKVQAVCGSKSSKYSEQITVEYIAEPSPDLLDIPGYEPLVMIIAVIASIWVITSYQKRKLRIQA